MGDCQGRPGAVNLGSVVGVNLNLANRIVCLAVIAVTRTSHESTSYHSTLTRKPLTMPIFLLYYVGHTIFCQTFDECSTLIS